MIDFVYGINVEFIMSICRIDDFLQLIWFLFFEKINIALYITIYRTTISTVLKEKYKNLRIYYKKSTNIKNPKIKIQVIYFTVYQKLYYLRTTS